MIETKQEAEKAVLIAINYPGQDERDTQEYIEELAFLSETAGVIPVKRFTQKLPQPDNRTFVGSGKIEEIANFVKENAIDYAIFDDELSPSQIKNIDKILGCRVLDRTNLILDIFAKRARTSHARTQVELAQYKYMLPRLTGMWTHLERQRGGIGLRGPGETEIERTDGLCATRYHSSKNSSRRLTNRWRPNGKTAARWCGYHSWATPTWANQH